MRENTHMPLMLPYGKDKEYPDAPKSIPFTMLDEKMAGHVHSQTLQRLSERGGLDPVEMLALMSSQNIFSGEIDGIAFLGMAKKFAIDEINQRLVEVVI